MAQDPRIKEYKDGYRLIEESIQGVSESELDFRPAPAEWTIREIIVHLGDSEMTSSVRLRRMLTEDQPVLTGYDQDAYAERFWYQNRSIESSLLLFRAARLTSGELLDRLDEDDWSRTALHSESGEITVDSWLDVYAVHAREHADQINNNLEQARSLATSSPSEPSSPTVPASQP